jgi:lysophospholipase L1-like esterase
LKSLTLSLCALLAACGGGSDAPTAPPIRSIQLYGDSTQWYAAPDWQAQWPGMVTSDAVPGTTSGQLLAGTDGKNPAWPGNVTADLVVIKFGANDCLPWFFTSVEQYKANLRALVAATSARVVLETPDPTMDPYRPNEGAYTQAMRDVASELHLTLIDTDACWRAYGDWQSFLMADQEHANPAGRLYTVQHCAAPVIDAILAGQQ